MPFVSIIVPVYNAEKYLARCLDSILSQTYTDTEIIVVDDGSTDNSVEICKKYADAHDDLALITQKNMGPAHARNMGLSIANGDLIQFVDADDWIMPTATEQLVYGITSQKSGLSVCSFFRYDGIETRTIKLGFDGLHTPNCQLMEFAHGVPDALLHFGSCVNKIYVKSIIDKYSVAFPDTRQANEDAFFNLEYIRHINKVWVVDKPLYVYFTPANRESMTTRYRENAFEMNEKLYRAIEVEIGGGLNDEERRLFNRHYIDKTLIVLKMLAVDNPFFTPDALFQKFAQIAAHPHVKAALSNCAPQGSQDNRAIELLKNENIEQLYAFANGGIYI